MNAEQTWWSLSLSERLYLERAVSAIIRYYGGQSAYVLGFIRTARNLGYDAPIQQAVLWRLEQEIS